MNLSRGRVQCALAALLVAGCGVLEPGSDVLRVANQAEPASIDPHRLTGLVEMRIASALFEGLVRLHGDTVEPALALAWDISDDGLQWTFRLDPARTFSDGRPLRSADVAASLRRATDPAEAFAYADLLDPIKGAASRRRAGPDTLGIETPDDTTLVLRLERPTPWLLSLLAQPIAGVVPMHVIARHGARWTSADHLVASGPFHLHEHRAHRRIVVIRRADPGAGAPRPRIDTLTFLPVEDQLTAWKMLRAGQIDWILQVPTSRLDAARKLSGFRSTPRFATYFYRVNVTRPPLDDPRVRRALALALPREAIVRHIVRGGELSACGLVPPGIVSYSSPCGLETDFAEARRLLVEAGYPEGRGLRPLALLHNTHDLHRRLAEVVAAIWKDSLGIVVRPASREWKSYLAAMDSLDYDIARGSWVGDFLDPETFLGIFRSGSGNNRTGWADSSYDEMLDRANARAVGSGRDSLLAQAEVILQKAAPVLPLYHYNNVEVRGPRVDAPAPGALGMPDWRRVGILRSSGS